MEVTILFVPLWLFDEKGGYALNADDVDLIQVREIPDSNPIRYGFEVFTKSGGRIILNGPYFESKEDAVKALGNVTESMYQRFQVSLINVVASGIYAALIKFETDKDKIGVEDAEDVGTAEAAESTEQTEE